MLIVTVCNVLAGQWSFSIGVIELGHEEEEAKRLDASGGGSVIAYSIDVIPVTCMRNNVDW